MTYKLTYSSETVRTSDGAVIPASTENGDYTAYLAWLSEGNTPEPADVPPPPTKAERIRALEAQASDAQAKVTRQALLALALEKACADPAAAGLTPSEVHEILMTGDNGYRALYLLEQQVEAIRAE